MKNLDPNVPDKKLYDLAFDQFSRQYQAKRLVETVRTKKRLRILDVGGNNGATRAFFPQDEVRIVDLYDVDEPWYTKASALDLPFKDNSFDIVTCFDVYEHIEQKDRPKFMSEISRVAKHYVLVAAPFGTQYVSDAEKELNAYYARITGSDHRWLREHIDNGLPDKTEIENFFKKSNLEFATYNSNNILLWTAMQNLIFLADAVKAPERMSSLNRYYNQHMPNMGDGQEPSYRRIYFAAKSGRLPKPVEIEEPVSLEVLRQWVNTAAMAMHELIYGSEPLRAQTEAVKTQAELLGEKDREIAALKNKLDDILGSRSYRIAQALKKTKNSVLPRHKL